MRVQRTKTIDGYRWLLSEWDGAYKAYNAQKGASPT
jgi:hypothetical protein